MKRPNPTTERPPDAPLPAATNDEQTGLPGLTTWPKVYWLVAGSFGLWVILLFVLTKAFA